MYRRIGYVKETPDFSYDYTDLYYMNTDLDWASQAIYNNVIDLDARSIYVNVGSRYLVDYDYFSSKKHIWQPHRYGRSELEALPTIDNHSLYLAVKWKEGFGRKGKISFNQFDPLALLCYCYEIHDWQGLYKVVTFETKKQ